MTSRILITGASGFVGGRLARHLLGQGHELHLLVRDPARLAPGLQQQCRLHIGGLDDTTVLDAAVRDVDLVYHCAANVSTWDTEEAYLAANRDGVRKLIQALAGRSTALQRLLHVSTMDVYGFPENPASEDSPPAPGNFGYGLSKAAGEAVVRELCPASGIPFTIVRPGNVIGPGSQFVERIGQELDRGLMLKIDHGKIHAGLVHVDNLVRYLECLAHSDQAAGQTFNIRDPYDATWADFIAVLKAGIHGHGLVINLPFGVADFSARWISRLSASLLPAREPLLHPLLVRMFGRTCGHDASRLYTICILDRPIGFDEGMRQSIEWFNRTFK